MTNLSYHIPIWLMGFISGMTILLSGNTMNFWLTQEKLDKTSIGMFALVSLPYAISFVWSPILDHIRIPFLSRFFGMRFSWIIVLQISLSLAISQIGKVSPHENLELFAILGLLISFLSSTQDVALGALRAKILPPGKQGTTSGVYIFGYRIGMLIGSSGAIYASVYMSWSEIYVIFSNIILYFPIVLYIACMRHLTDDMDDANPSFSTILGNLMRSPKLLAMSRMTNTMKFWHQALQNVGPTSFIITILLYLILYRLPDNFISIMINPFLVETGFDALHIATVGKFLGITTAIIGGLIAGYAMNRIKIIDALLYFGIIHALSHLLFIFQNHMGDNIYSLFLVIGIESTTGGMVMAAYIAFITGLCSGKYSATQYAFFSSMMGISRSIFPSIAGIIATDFGWNNFFLFVTVITIPPLWMSVKVRKMLEGRP